VIGIAVLGAALGARHALEPDHLAAVSTLVAERPRPRQAAMLGALWGLGHAAALLAVGAVLLLAHAALPERAVMSAEIAVAIMLIGLGARSLVRAFRGGDGPAATHRHGALEHHHAGAPRHVHLGDRPLALRPLVIGLLHGLAGSGALTALAVAEMATTAGALGYIAAFAIGSVAGMTVVSGVAGLSLARMVSGRRGRTTLLAASGALSVIVGVVWAISLA
jgi:high-affinity nickel-transport protein